MGGALPATRTYAGVKTCRSDVNAIGTLPLLAALVAAPAVSPAATEPSQATEPSRLQNPVPYSRSSIQRGRVLYVRHCPICHGADGKALIELVANATDLTAPERWRYGTSDGEIFRSIRDGVGVDMPPYATYIKNEDDLWHLVNFMRSIGPASMRPELVPDEGGAPVEEAQGPGEDRAQSVAVP
jgi:mono/diheme cytochrome c family protein